MCHIAGFDPRNRVVIPRPSKVRRARYIEVWLAPVSVIRSYAVWYGFFRKLAMARV